MSHASFIVRFATADSFVAEYAASHGALFDVEAGAQPGSFNVVARSKDKTVVGKAKDASKAELRFNDATGAAVALVVGTAQPGSQDAADVAAARALAQDVAADMIGFFSRAENVAFSAAVGAFKRPVESGAALNVALAIFGGKTQNRNGWRVGSFVALEAERLASQRKAIESAARVLQNAAALKALTGSQPTQPGAPGAVGIDALLAQVAAALATVQNGAPPSQDIQARPSDLQPAQPVAQPAQDVATCGHDQDVSRAQPDATQPGSQDATQPVAQPTQDVTQPTSQPTSQPRNKRK